MAENFRSPDIHDQTEGTEGDVAVPLGDVEATESRSPSVNLQSSRRRETLSGVPEEEPLAKWVSAGLALLVSLVVSGATESSAWSWFSTHMTGAHDVIVISGFVWLFSRIAVYILLAVIGNRTLVSQYFRWRESIYGQFVFLYFGRTVAFALPRALYAFWRSTLTLVPLVIVVANSGFVGKMVANGSEDTALVFHRLMIVVSGNPEELEEDSAENWPSTWDPTPALTRLMDRVVGIFGRLREVLRPLAAHGLVTTVLTVVLLLAIFIAMASPAAAVKSEAEQDYNSTLGEKEQEPPAGAVEPEPDHAYDSFWRNREQQFALWRELAMSGPDYMRVRMLADEYFVWRLEGLHQQCGVNATNLGTEELRYCRHAMETLIIRCFYFFEVALVCLESVISRLIDVEGWCESRSYETCPREALECYVKIIELLMDPGNVPSKSIINFQGVISACGM